MKTNTQKMAAAAMLAACICVATLFFRIPTASGYVHLGDALVLLSGWLLSPMYGVLAAGIGSALADILSGYMAYAPATLLIKAGMAYLAYLGLRFFKGGVARLVGGMLAILWLVLGYFLVECFLYGLPVAMVQVIPNILQGGVGLLIGYLCMQFLKKR